MEAVSIDTCNEIDNTAAVRFENRWCSSLLGATMELLSINVSPVRETTYKGRTVSTGIFKEPVEGQVLLRCLSLAGDEQADLKGHGGPNRAVYVYTTENYEYWKRELDRDDFRFGQFGENFTVHGGLEDQVHVGDVYEVGSARVQVTQPRVPCYKLGIKMGDPGFVKVYLRSCRVGFYFRVLQEGGVRAGDRLELVESDPMKMTVREICHLYYFDPKNLEASQRALRIEALSPGWRQGFEERLVKAGIEVEPESQPGESTCCEPGDQEEA